MGKALYRAYRPKRLADVVGQEHVTTTLANALKSGKVSHAYLLTGPRGTGKTTIARIFAHEINQLEYLDDSTHLDIIEIDAASNRRIDEIRELRERVHNAPTSVKYKVYIIDEVHMLTKEAFNALLKTLEEPPEHAIFILATTEVHKLPDTIISRTQRFSLKPASDANIIGLLKSIAQQESFVISDEALAVVAEAGRGSFRDSLSLLDQARNAGDKISVDDIYRVLGIAPKAAVAGLQKSLLESPGAVVACLNELRSSGYQSGQLAKQLAAELRNDVLSASADMVEPYLELLHQLLEVPRARDIDAKLELLLVGFALKQNPNPATPRPLAAEPNPTPISTPEQPKPTKAQPEPMPVKQTSVSSKSPEQNPATPDKTSAPIEPTSQPEQQPEPSSPSTPSSPAQPFSPEVWQQALANIKQKYNTLYGVVRMAQPEMKDDTLILKFAFGFHQKRINEPKNKQVVAQIISDLTGMQYAISSVVDKAASPPPSTPVAATPPASPSAATQPAPNPTPSGQGLDTISTIFGGAEVLES